MFYNSFIILRCYITQNPQTKETLKTMIPKPPKWSKTTLYILKVHPFCTPKSCTILEILTHRKSGFRTFRLKPPIPVWGEFWGVSRTPTQDRTYISSYKEPQTKA